MMARDPNERKKSIVQATSHLYYQAPLGAIPPSFIFDM